MQSHSLGHYDCRRLSYAARSARFGQRAPVETALDRMSDAEAEGKLGRYAPLAHDTRFRFRLPVRQ